MMISSFRDMREYIAPEKTEGKTFEEFLRHNEYVTTLALIQIAQELNEIKHALKEWDYDFNVKVVNWPDISEE
jgi:hypothetical protein